MFWLGFICGVLFWFYLGQYLTELYELIIGMFK